MTRGNDRGADRVDAAILNVLAEQDGAAGAARIGRELARMGVNVQPRTIRFRLARMDAAGLTERVSRRAGRRLLPAGRKELEQAHIMERLGFVAARVDVLAYRMTFDPRASAGSIIANVALIRRRDLARALQIIEPILNAGLGMGNRLAVAHAGELLAGVRIPPGRIGVATVCSVVVNGMLLKRGIPVDSRFGGLLELRDGAPSRFVHLIDYAGTTIDPLEAFIKAGMTSVGACAASGSGIIGASFREVPAVARDAVLQAEKERRAAGLSGILVTGRPNQSLLEIPVSEGRIGMVVIGGMNPFAALFEAGIPVDIESLSGLEDWERFQPYTAFRTMAHVRAPYID
jgi:HTH-type transcriptional regulator, global nitrogen regulator NrpRI